MNLVGHAVKYSPTGGPVHGELAARDRQAEITIKDTGIGISQDAIGRLGHPFVRGAGRASTFTGMGVGLYVARIVAEAHAGSLALDQGAAAAPRPIRRGPAADRDASLADIDRLNDWFGGYALTLKAVWRVAGRVPA